MTDVRQRDIRMKTVAAYLSAFLVLVVVAIGVYALERVDHTQQWVEHSTTLINQSSRLELALVEARSIQRHLLTQNAFGQSSEVQESAAFIRESVATQLGLLRSLIVRQEVGENSRLETITREIETFLVSIDESFGRSLLGAREAFEALMEVENADIRFAELQATIRDFSLNELTLREHRMELAFSEHRTLRITLVLSGCAAFVLMIFIISLIRKGFSALTESMETVAEQQEMLRVRTRELEQTVAELDQFAYVASHDLKAPLRGIANLTQWISEDAREVLSEESLKQLDMLNRRVVRMDSLVNGILEFARAGRAEPQIQDVEVTQLIQEALELITPHEGVKVYIETTFPCLRTMRSALLQVWMNLLSNAVKHGVAEGGEIRLGACQNDSGEYLYYIKDSGPGIDPRFHMKVFGIFQTLKPKDRQESTGIGLAIVKKLVERAGGRIWIESEVGKGTCFWFTYPVPLASIGVEETPEKVQVFRWGKRGLPRVPTQDLSRVDDAAHPFK